MSVPLADTDAAERAFADILRELRSQYVLGYYPGTRSHDGGWHTVKVRSTRRGVKLRYRDGSRLLTRAPPGRRSAVAT